MPARSVSGKGSVYPGWLLPVSMQGWGQGRETEERHRDKRKLSGVSLHKDSNILDQCSTPLQYSWASLVAQLVKNLPAMWETWVRSLGWEDPLGKERLPTPVFWPG